MKTLIFAEKPDMGRSIASALSKYGSFNKNRNYLESEKYIVTWGYGHLYQAKLPEHYEEFGGWNWNSIPFYPPAGHLEYHLPTPKKMTAEQKKWHESLVDHAKAVNGLFKRSDISEVVNACDAGREGELIFWVVYEQAKIKKPVKRLWISDLTDETILKGFASLKDEAFYLPKRDSAYSRQFADWALGMNLTVAFTTKAREKTSDSVTLHVGRVQTPTLSLLVQRRLEIENFKADNYFEIQATFGDKYKGQWFKGEKGNTRFEKREEAQAVVDKVSGKIGEVVKKDVVEEKKEHDLLYSLNTLQQHANRKYGFGAQKTLDIIQVLYEKYKYLTYPRTDSQHLSTAMVGELEPTLKALGHGDYAKFSSAILAKGVKTTSRFVDDAEVSDHHAIIPTKKRADLSSITDDKAGSASDIVKIYDMVAKRFLSAFYPPAIYEKTEIVTEVENETFKTSGKILVEAGWLEVYGKEAEEDEDEAPVAKKGGKKQQEEAAPVVKLPPIDLGEKNPASKVDLQAKETQPPKHYTEGTLLKVMENPRKFLEDKEMQDVLKTTGAGLGTPATRAAFIETIVSRGYVEKKGKSLIATDHGVKLIQIAPEALKSPIVTADWEQKLKTVEEEKLARSAFEEGIKRFVQENIDSIKGAELEVKFVGGGHGGAPGKVIAVCPDCGSDVVEKDKVFACVNDTADSKCFKLFKEMSGKKLSAKIAKQLCAQKPTETVSGFKSKAGKEFSAPLVWNPEEKRVNFVFGDAPASSGGAAASGVKCPICAQGSVRESAKAFGCSNWQSGCKFTVWKEIMGKKMTLSIVEEIAKNGATKKMKGFKGRDGKELEASLVLNKETNKVEPKFG